MRRGVVLGLSLALAGAASPAAAAFVDFENWNFCSGNSLSLCFDFNLEQDNADLDSFRLTVTYLAASVGDDGIVTAVGLYRLPAEADVDVSNVSPDLSGWDESDNGLSGGGATVFEVAAGTNGVGDGFTIGESIVITFNSTTPDLLGGLYARAHVQSLGENNCSLKPDSEVDGNVVGGVDEANRSCGFDDGGGGEGTVPEPISMVLLGSGLLGLGGVRLRRRRD